MRLASILLGLGLGVVQAGAQDATRPNILLLFADDHAYQAVSAYGSGLNETPNIDRLAREGMLFRNCFVGNSICGPSRATILTGLYSHRNGFRRNGDVFDGGQETMPKLLRQAGYQTAVIGKWHLGSLPTGFDHYEVLIGQGPYYNPPMRRNGPDPVRHTGYTTDVIRDLTLEWLKNGRDPDKPFLLMSQHKAPHRNWQPGPRHLDLYDGKTIPEPPSLFSDNAGLGGPAAQQTMSIERDLNPHDLKLVEQGGMTAEQRAAWDAAYGPKNEAFRQAGLEGEALVRWKYQRYIKDYLRCIASVDESVGAILDYLDESGLADNTVVIYSSDQGFYLGEHGWFDKRWVYEESLRTPLLIRWPGVTAPGSENHLIVSNLDLAQTFLELASAPAPGSMQGASLAPLLRGDQPADWRTSFYYHYYEYPGAHDVRRHEAVVDGRYKLIHFYEPDVDLWQLIDLHSDPGETRSFHEDPAYRDTREGLYAELIRLRDRYGVTDPPRAD